MTIKQFTDALTSIEALAQSGLKTVAALDPETTPATNAVATVLPIVSSIITVALTAWSNANGTEITAESIQALLPNATPLTPPEGA